MAKSEWFRRITWTDEDRREFTARLGRSRSTFHKAQYLRIQALHLERDADPPRPDAALELLDQLLHNYPEPFELAAALEQRARCLRQLGHSAEALNACCQALEMERRYPNVRGTAYLEYAELVLELQRSDLYEEAVVLLVERSAEEPFPFLQYRSRVARAFLCERLGREVEARDSARHRRCDEN